LIGCSSFSKLHRGHGERRWNRRAIITGAIAHRLLSAGVDVVLVSSVVQARYRETKFNSWDKNDPKDASVILEMLKHEMVMR
jgi:hypothetical protein